MLAVGFLYWYDAVPVLVEVSPGGQACVVSSLLGRRSIRKSRGETAEEKMRKTVLITGASSGIGRATALLFQSNGWNVAATMRSPEKEVELNQLAHVICPALDVQEPASIQAAVQETLSAFGRIDAVVNNAGYGLIGAFETFSPEQIERQFATNVFGLMHVTRAVLPHMREHRSGHIINVASFAGRSVFPFYSVYHASKWAVEGFSDSLAYEASCFGVRVKIIEPGTIRTAFWGRSTDRENASGVQAYDALGKPVLNLIDAAAATISARSEDVAAAICKAVEDDSSRLRYVVGMDAHLTLTARKLLPDALYNAVMRATFQSPATRWLGELAGRLQRTV